MGQTNHILDPARATYEGFISELRKTEPAVADKCPAWNDMEHEVQLVWHHAWYAGYRHFMDEVDNLASPAEET